MFRVEYIRFIDGKPEAEVVQTLRDDFTSAKEAVTEGQRQLHLVLAGRIPDP